MTTPMAAVVGLGEVGAPLLELVEAAGVPAIGIDLEPVALPPRGTLEVLHIGFPYQVGDFVAETAGYIETLGPKLTIIHSTVTVGTTRAVAARTGAPVVYSPVRGKHARMREEMLRYVKFVGGMDEASTRAAADHLEAIGMRTAVMPSPETAELAKLTETTYFGLLIAWAQDVERYCDRLGVGYDDVVGFYDEIPFLPPVRYHPGVIGGHCVMPNIDLLLEAGDSWLLAAITESNLQKLDRERQRMRDRNRVVFPLPTSGRADTGSA